jgi:hypothetical protein
MAGLYVVSRNFGLKEGDLRRISDLDLNLDGWVNMVDLYSVATHFGDTSLQ